MTRYIFNVAVDTDTPEHAVQVISERTGYDEQYEDPAGVKFDYRIDWVIPSGDQHDELRDACDIFYLSEDA